VENTQTTKNIDYRLILASLITVCLPDFFRDFHFLVSPTPKTPLKFNFDFDLLLNLKMKKHMLIRTFVNSTWDFAAPDAATKNHYLVRDFIHDSLYGSLGYFTSHASILSPEPFDFKTFKDQDAFLTQIGKSYAGYNSQIWHTPSEIFKPWFGTCIAEYLVKKRKSDKMVIYEMGPGNGTLMIDILDAIKARYPALYSNIEYNAIEISPVLIKILQEKSKNEHSNKINIRQISIFDWDKVDDRDCFFLGMEVIDNFPHDIIRYNYQTLEPLECHIAESFSQELVEVYRPVQDGLIKKYLDFRNQVGQVGIDRAWKQLRRLVPMAPNMTQKEFIPTKCFEFLEKIHKCFPNHSLLLSDFTKLDRSVAGITGPVVQTMVDGVMLPCTTYLVSGAFDIFFPTDFKLLSKMVQHISNKTVNVVPYSGFLKPYHDSQKTVVKSGENPMLNFYDNYAFLEAY
jgi:hypothetical protein